MKDEYNTFSCNLKKKRKKPRFKPIYKKIKSDKLYFLVKEHILSLRDKDEKYVFAEDIAKKFQVKKHEIKEAFKKLNQEGILGQAENSAPHDCRRAIFWWDIGKDNSWMASRYHIRKVNDE